MTAAPAELSLATAYSAGSPPAICGQLRSTPEDFRVCEDLGFEPSGAGEHVLLLVRKRDANTQWVADELAAFAGLKTRLVSYAGLKDRQAVAEQWFSVHLPGAGADIAWNAFRSDHFEVLRHHRHHRKLKRGTLAGNRFQIVIRNLAPAAGAGPTEPVTADSVQDPFDLLDLSAKRIRRDGVPNYFGEQRFGRDGGNLGRAVAMFEGRLRVRGRHQSGLYLSAARSYLFNQVVSRRVSEKTWDRILPGEAVMLAGSRSVFVWEPGAADASARADIDARLAAFDIHPSGPLWGRGEALCRDEAHRVEAEVAAKMSYFTAGLEHAGLQQERRVMRLLPAELTLERLSDSAAEIKFWLPAGCYATSVLRELISWTDTS